MPEDQGHNAINVNALLIGAPVAIYFLGYEALAGVCAFLFASLAFNPDLDLKSDPYAHWGLLKWYWWLYQRLIPHRDAISHGPLIGTTVRLLYLSPLVALVLGSCVAAEITTVPDIHAWAFEHRRALYIAFCGLELNALLHIAADLITTWFKRTW